MFDRVKNLFKAKEVKRDPRVSYIEVDRVPIKKFEPKRFEPKKFNPARTDKLMRIRYTDTDEIKVLSASVAIDEIMRSMRPVIIEGFVE